MQKHWYNGITIYNENRRYTVLDHPSRSQEEVIATNIANVRAQIVAAAERVGRHADEVTLVAVSKTKPLEMIQAAYRAGLRDFGENRVQEVLTKQEAFSPSDLHWHMIGHVQTNKVKKAFSRFSYIHSIDSLHVAQALQLAAERRLAEGAEHEEQIERLSVRQPILLQVNIAGEASKEGMSPDEVPALARQIAALSHLEIRGLMTIAPLVSDPEQVRPVFRRLRELRDTLRQQLPECNWQHLSMGMTDDYPVAIEEGATIVRIGRAIFGERNRK
jgi:pyridoxal phosphate enzyme (YggS family)